jgi:hypothetical protein
LLPVDRAKCCRECRLWRSLADETSSWWLGGGCAARLCEKGSALLNKGALKAEEFAQRPEFVASREPMYRAMQVCGLPTG